VVKKHDGLLTVHMRDEGIKIFEALEEMFRVARESGVHLHISHLKLLHHSQWGRADELLGKIRAAQAEGLFITADQYPYDASSTTLTSLLPGWAYDGGNAALVARLKDPAQRKRIDPEIESKMAGRGGPNCIRIAATQNVLSELEDLTVAQIAEKWGLSPVDTVVRLLVECNGSVGIISHSISQKDVERIMKEMDIAVCSDGSAFPMDPALVPGKPHRRHYGTFPQFLQLVREKQLMPIEDAVYKITGFPAKTMGLLDRGILKQGYAADITLFDPAEVQDLTTYGNPFVKPRGLDYVFVSGEPVVYQGELTEARNGKFILSAKK
jgi:N-acyl-D-amino-acid deacylase